MRGYRPPTLAAVVLLSAFVLLASTGCQELQDLRQLKQIQDQRITELTRRLEQKVFEYDLLLKQNRENEKQIQSLSENRAQVSDELNKRKQDLANADKQAKTLAAELEAKTSAFAQSETNLGEQTKLAQSLAAEVSTKQTEILKNQEAVRSKEAESAKLKKELQAATSANRGQMTELKKEHEALKEKLKTTEAGGTGSDSDFDEALGLLKQSLKPHIDAKVATVSREPRGVVVRLSVDYLFKGGVVDLDPDVHSTLNAIAAILGKYPKKYVEVQGHTDSAPITNMPFADNWALASARADKVVRYLAEHTSLDARHLKSSSASQYRPAPAQGSPPGQKMDRRVEIVLSNQP